MDWQTLFINKDDVLLVRKELVKLLGNLNDAIVFNQIHYWIEINKKSEKNFHDGKYWVFNTYKDWQEKDFDFWSEDTIKRSFTRLEKLGVVVSANYNKYQMDKTKWYSMDYDALQNLYDRYLEKQNASTESADCAPDRANCTDGQGSMHRAIPENTYKEINNRDYNTENTDSKELNNACFSDGKGTVAHERPKRTFSFEERMEMLNKMPERAKKIATDKGYDFDCANNIADFVFYFVLRYYQKTGDTHPILKNDTLEYVIEKVTENQVDEYREFGALVTDDPGDERYKYAVDDYFGTKFRKDVNYNLSHFVSGDIIKNLMYHTGEFT